MSVAVFPLRLWYPLKHELKLQTIVADMGDGFEQRIGKSIGFSAYNTSGSPVRGDGQGNSGVNYPGINIFTIAIKNMVHINGDATQQANKLWNFYIQQQGRLTPFWFYNPAETPIPDLTAATTTGRYYVRFDTDMPSRDLTIRNLYSVSGIKLVEVHS